MCAFILGEAQNVVNRELSSPVVLLFKTGSVQNTQDYTCADMHTHTHTGSNLTDKCAVKVTPKWEVVYRQTC